MQPVTFWQQANNSIPQELAFLELDKSYTAKRARPLARRALITAAPPLVFMRVRKPWVRFLFMTDG